MVSNCIFTVRFSVSQKEEYEEKNRCFKGFQINKYKGLCMLLEEEDIKRGRKGRTKRRVD